MTIRILSLATLLLAFPTASFAQKEPDVVNGKVTYSLQLHPTAAPVPLFKMHIYPEYSDLQPGNRVQGLLKVFMEQDNFFRTVGNEEWFKDLNCPLSEFKRDLNIGGIAYGEKYTHMGGYLDRGARYKTIDWNEYFELRKDGFYLLLPEVQKMRALAMVLRMRLRNEVKRGEFDKAIVSIQSIFGLAQALEQHPTLIGFLVGIAIAEEARKGLEEMIQQPGCPNLFWALSDIPQPAFSLRAGIGGERLFLESQYANVLKTDRVLTDHEIDDFLKDANDLLRLEDQRGGEFPLLRNAKIRFALIAADNARMEATRKRLIKDGAKPEIVKDMSIMQLAILDDFQRYIVLRDDFFKSMNLPYHQFSVFQKSIDQQTEKSRKQGDIMGPAVIPAAWKVKTVQARFDQRIAMLRITEAIRLYAFEHGGKLPESLDDIKLPIPRDPVTDKPFTYSVIDGVATLHGIKLISGDPGLRVYEIRVKK